MVNVNNKIETLHFWASTQKLHFEFNSVLNNNNNYYFQYPFCQVFDYFVLKLSI